MSVRSSVMSTTVAPSRIAGRRVIVEFRAATPDEVRAIDTSAPEVALAAHLLINRQEWRRATSPFPVNQFRTNDRSLRPPGSLIWAQLASRSGSMLVGGRDRFGMPSVPVPAANGDIFFVSAVPDAGTRPQLARVPFMSLEHVIVEPDECQPILAAAGEITCASTGCAGCLTVLSRNSWSTSIACVCD